MGITPARREECTPDVTSRVIYVNCIFLLLKRIGLLPQSSLVDKPYKCYRSRVFSDTHLCLILWLPDCDCTMSVVYLRVLVCEIIYTSLLIVMYTCLHSNILFSTIWQFSFKLIWCESLCLLPDAARRFYQTISETTALKDKGKYDAKVIQQRRKNRVTRVRPT